MTTVPHGRSSLENIALISIDSLRADHCSFMRRERNTTPTLDRLAADGLVFENAIAPGPRTPSSMPVAFTGQFNEPSTFSYGDWGHRYGRISEHLHRYRTLPERLQAAGYTTVGVTLNPWTQQTAFDTGFDRFVEVTGETVTENGDAPALSVLDSVMGKTGLGKRIDWRLTKDWFVQWTDYYETIIESLDGVSEPYFLWVFSLDSHQPYLAPAKYRTESSRFGMYYANVRESIGSSAQEDVPDSVQSRLKRAYRDAVRSADGFVDELVEDLTGDPAVIVHSDHGEAFGEHGYWGHPSKLYEENIHVPIVVSNGLVRGRVSAPVSLQCLPDLVAAVSSGEIFDPETFTRKYVMAATEGLGSAALRGNRWKYIIDDGDEEVYDLRDDPMETTDLSEIHPELTTRLGQLLTHKRYSADEQTQVAKAVQALEERAARSDGATEA